VITSENGTKILTDPYESGAYDGNIRYAPIKEKVDVVTVSHEHADHGHLKDLPGEPVILRGAGGYVASGISFQGISAFHDKSHGAERGVSVIFTFIVDDIKVCHLGDLGHELSSDQAAEAGAVDVLLTPVGGLFTIDAKEAWTVANQLASKIVIPMHFKTPKVGFPIAPVDEFIKDKPNVKRLGKSEVEINKNTLPSEREIIVLEPAL
ncbi:MAG: MBL fold metallo-hydrolase, partial [Armatimonadota bacterium]|nr:MBL fold metallo-hydrolase [Armatimonadota bacterium]